MQQLYEPAEECEKTVLSIGNVLFGIAYVVLALSHRCVDMQFFKVVSVLRWCRYCKYGTFCAVNSAAIYINYMCGVA